MPFLRLEGLLSAFAVFVADAGGLQKFRQTCNAISDSLHDRLRRHASLLVSLILIHGIILRQRLHEGKVLRGGFYRGDDLGRVTGRWSSLVNIFILIAGQTLFRDSVSSFGSKLLIPKAYAGCSGGLRSLQNELGVTRVKLGKRKKNEHSCRHQWPNGFTTG
jgi:hypothetical protein